MSKNKRNDGSDNTYFYIIPSDFLALFARNPLSEFLVVTDIGLYPKAKHHSCTRNEGIEEAILIYCSEGHGLFSTNNSAAMKVNPEQILIIPPGVPHRYDSSYDDPWTIFWMHVKGSFFDSFYKNWKPAAAGCVMDNNNLAPELITISDTAGQRIKEIFYQCFSILRTPYQWEEFFHLCQLAATVISIIPGASKRSASRLTENGNRGIEAAISYMTIHLHESINLEELASVACFSPSHLNYLFREFYGYAPIDYFLRMKIQAAAKEVFFSDMTIREISETYGINDPYYFHGCLKR